MKYFFFQAFKGGLYTFVVKTSLAIFDKACRGIKPTTIVSIKLGLQQAQKFCQYQSPAIRKIL